MTVQRGAYGEGSWFQAPWKRRRYYVEAGYLRPVLGSAVSDIDLMNDGYYGADNPKEGRSMYLELLDLGEGEDEAALERFANKWGLFGLLHHQLVQVRFLGISGGDRVLAPGEVEVANCEVVERPDYLLRSGVAFLEGSTLRRVFQETTGGNVWRRVQWGPGWPVPPASPVGLGTALVREGLLSEVIREVPLERLYGPFFPDLDGSTERPYPELHSARVWDYLCEPIHEIRAALQRFRFVASLVDELAAGRPVIPADVARQLNTSLARIHPAALASPEGRLSFGWSIPCLLDAAFFMLFLDSTNDRFHHCANRTCNRWFTSDRSDRRYCTPTCMRTAKQRDYRERERAKRQGDPQ